MVYRNIQCPYCKHSFTSGYVSLGPGLSNLGVPTLTCPRCRRISQTGRKPWSQMATGAKVLYFMLRFLQSIPNAVVLGALGMMVLEMGFKKQVDLVVGFGVAWAVSAALLILHGSRSIRAIEEAYRKGENVIID